MSSELQNNTNIDRCNGCQKHCQIVITKHYNGFLTSFWPTIANRPLEEFCDENHIRLSRTDIQPCNSWQQLRMHNLWFGLLSQDSAMDMARDITKICMRYRAHQK